MNNVMQHIFCFLNVWVLFSAPLLRCVGPWDDTIKTDTRFLMNSTICTKSRVGIVEYYFNQKENDSSHEVGWNGMVEAYLTKMPEEDRTLNPNPLIALFFLRD